MLNYVQIRVTMTSLLSTVCVHCYCCHIVGIRQKGKILLHSLPRLGPELIPMYRQSASRRLFKSSRAVYRLPLLSARAAFTFPAEKRHRPSTSTELYCLVTEAYKCEQLAQGCYAALSRWELNTPLIDRKSNAVRLYATVPPIVII